MMGHPYQAAIVRALVAVGLCSGASHGQSPAKPAGERRPSPAGILVDPGLITQVDQVWTLVGRPDNPVWPGWDARETPVLIYMPNRQDLLINHPRPPEGFRRYEGPLKSSLGPIHVRDGETLIALDGQNTATDVAGVQTLVVADTLSARRQWAEGLIGAAKADPAAAKAQIDRGLRPNPYPAFGLFSHEAFHVYQHRRAPKKAPNEGALAEYPSLSVENNVGFALESEYLRAALEAGSPDEARAPLRSWLATRLTRRKALPKSSVEYEDATEFSEGTAKYVEYRLMQCLESTEPLDNLWLIQGFQGFGDLSSQRAEMLNQMRRMMSGEMSVNNDPYGASPVRFRLYFSGMALGAALDKLGVAWHDKIFEPTATLTGLLASELAMTPEEIEAEAARVRSGERHAELARAKAKLEDDGKAHIAAALAEFDAADGDLIIDYSRLDEPGVGFTYTSFGILRLSDDQTLYRLVPISGKVQQFEFAEDAARPMLHDKKARTIRLQLPGKPDPEDLARQLGAPLSPDHRIDIPQIKIPGVTMKGIRGTIRLDGKRLTIALGE